MKLLISKLLLPALAGSTLSNVPPFRAFQAPAFTQLSSSISKLSSSYAKEFENHQAQPSHVRPTSGLHGVTHMSGLIIASVSNRKTFTSYVPSNQQQQANQDAREKLIMASRKVVLENNQERSIKVKADGPIRLRIENFSDRSDFVANRIWLQPFEKSAPTLDLFSNQVLHSC